MVRSLVSTRAHSNGCLSDAIREVGQIMSRQGTKATPPPPKLTFITVGKR
jgi:hypothetical protein